MEMEEGCVGSDFGRVLFARMQGVVEGKEDIAPGGWLSIYTIFVELS